MNQGKEFEVKIEKLAFGGQAVVKIDGFVIFIEGGIPGQKVLAKLTKNKKKFGEAKIVKVLEKSPLEIEPKCKHFGECGGCSLQNLEYKTQLEFKEKQVFECLKSIGKIEDENQNNKDFKNNKIISGKKIFGYRNKVEFSFGYEKMSILRDEKGNKIYNDTGETVGFHKKGKWQEVIEIKNCELISENANKILNLIKNWCINQKEKHVYNPYSHKGIWRHLLIRENLKGEIMINLVIQTNEKGNEKNVEDELENFIKESDINSLSNKLKELGVKSFYLTSNNGLNDDWSKGKYKIVFGENVIYEKILDLNFAISPGSFFQTNSLGAEILYGTVINFAKGDEENKKIILDLYCGTGTIGQLLGYHLNKNSKVIGIELIESAINNAIENAKLNNLKNTEFICGKVEDLLLNIIKKYGKIDLVVVDPPRNGMHSKALECLLENAPKQIIYVSCNPSTFSRDYNILKEKYKLVEIQPVDMFPHTSHIEIVGNLALK